MDKNEFAERLDDWNALEIYIKETVANLAGPLIHLIGAVSNAIYVESSDGQIQTGSQMDMNDLYNLAIKIPIECVYLQPIINEYSSGVAISGLLTENLITERIAEERNSPGDARERLRRAERAHENDLVIIEARKQIALSLQNVVHRADKVYEGIKKVIDASIRDNKGQ